MQAEQYEIYQQLDDLQLKTDLVVRPMIPDSGKWMETFSTYQGEGQLLVFHFAGHASPEALLFEEKDGEKVRMFVESLANLFQDNPPFLVFLNACRTYGFVEALLEVGVSVVIATHVKVDDGIAQAFAKQFYAELAKGKSIEQAFDFARSQPDSQKRISTVYYYQDEGRGLHPASQKKAPFDWLLYSRTARDLTWKLTTHLKPRSKSAPSRYLSAYSRIDLDTLIGRKRDLYAIQLLLNTHRTALLVNGMGGIGKTTLAKYYLQRYESNYDHIVWVDVLPSRDQAGGDVISAFVSEHNDILNLLELDLEPRMDELRQFKIGMRELKKLKGTNLLIIDNAAERLMEAMRYFPQSENWHVLVTSRQRFKACKVYEVETLPQEEAIQLFLTYYPAAKGDDLLALLLQRIGYHTLAIELIAKTLAKHPRLTLTKLWERMDKEGLKAANRMKVEVDHPQFQKSIKANDCVKQLFDIAGLTEEEQMLLLQFAVMPSMLIPFNTLVELLGIEEEREDDFIELLSDLVQKGWLRQGDNEYVCHQIIQEVVRQYITPTVDNCKTLLLSLTNILEIDDIKDNPVYKFQWLPYGDSLSKWMNEDKGEVAEFLGRLGIVLFHRGEYERSGALLEYALSIAEENYGKEDEKTSRFLNDLGLMYQYQGNYVEARDVYERALAIALKHLGSKHLAIAVNRLNLGTLLGNLGDYEGAKRELEQALALVIHNVGSDHPIAAVIHANLGLALRDLQDYEGAKKELELALSLAVRYFDSDDPRVMIAHSNLGLILRDLKDYKGARRELERALALGLHHLGSNHPSVAISRSNLGLVLLSLGDCEGAKRQTEEALLLEIHHLGFYHPNVATRYLNLAVIYVVKKELKHALEYFEKAYPILIQTFGENHPRTKNIATSIFSIRFQLNRP